MVLKKLVICLCFLMVISCGKDGIEDDYMVEISELEASIQNYSDDSFLIFSTKELFSCPNEIASFVEKDDRELEIFLGDKVFIGGPCFAIYMPSPAAARIDIPALAVDEPWDLVIHFKGNRIKGKFWPGESPSVSVEPNCCITVMEAVN